MSYYDRALALLEQFPIGTLRPPQVSVLSTEFSMFLNSGFFAQEDPPPQLRAMIEKAYSSFENPMDPLPVLPLQNEDWIMEEYHGPTASFKDLALQLTPQLFTASVDQAGKGAEDHCFIVATSGDTGSACLDGFGHNPNTPVIVLYPNGGVSPVQRAQMTSAGGDSYVLGVDGDFDFCQTTVKDMFNDKALNERLWTEYGVHLSAGNSINWGRLFPQVPYTFHAYLELVRQGRLELGEPMDLCVPTGNFGNILGGVVAKRMGLPVRKLVVAANENNILVDFIRTGLFDRNDRTLLKTMSASIDILLPSNLERYIYILSGGDAELVAKLFDDLAKSGRFELPADLTAKMRAELLVDWCNTDECLTTVNKVYQETKTLIDPHTAVAKFVVNKLRGDGALPLDGTPMVIASTAHHSKFPVAMLKALGLDTTGTVSEMLQRMQEVPSDTPIHSRMAEVPELPTLHEDVCAADPELVLQHIEGFLRRRKEQMKNKTQEETDTSMEK